MLVKVWKMVWSSPSITSDASIAGSGKRNTPSGTRTRAVTTPQNTMASLDTSIRGSVRGGHIARPTQDRIRATNGHTAGGSEGPALAVHAPGCIVAGN